MKKEKLIHGVWYKVLTYNSIYHKFDKYEDSGQIRMLLYKDSGRTIQENHTATNSDFWENVREAAQEELKTFLPSNHPDLIIERTYELW